MAEAVRMTKEGGARTQYFTMSSGKGGPAENQDHVQVYNVCRHFLPLLSPSALPSRQAWPSRWVAAPPAL